MLGPDGGYMVDADDCPVCGYLRVDGVCPWEDYSDEDLMQAMTIDAVGGGVEWAECVLVHNYKEEIANDIL